MCVLLFPRWSYTCNNLFNEGIVKKSEGAVIELTGEPITE